jgi:hypothetical protein
MILYKKLYKAVHLSTRKKLGIWLERRSCFQVSYSIRRIVDAKMEELLSLERETGLPLSQKIDGNKEEGQSAAGKCHRNRPSDNYANEEST